MTRRTARRWAAAALAFALAMTTAAQASAAPVQPTVKVASVRAEGSTLRLVLNVAGIPTGAAVDLRSVGVTAAGQPLSVQAAVQSGGTSASGALPDRVAMLVLDTSGSMQGPRIAAARGAADLYADTLPADVRIGLITFSDAATVALKPTRDRAAVHAALARVTASGNTSLFDAVSAAITAIGPSAPTQEKRILLLSDGADTSSGHTLAQILATLRASHIGLDAVGVSVSGDQLTVLHALAAAGAGQVLPTSALGQLSSAFVAAAATFTQEIEVTATLPAGLNGVSVPIAVSLDAAGTHVRATSAVAITSVAPPSPAEAARPGSAASAVPTAIPNPPTVLIALVFAGLLAVMLLLVWTPRAAAPASERLEQLERYGWKEDGAEAPGPAPAPVGNAATNVALSAADRLLRSRRSRTRIASDLERAGIRLRPQEWLILRFSAVVVAVAVTVLLTGSLPAGLIIGAVAGWGGTHLLTRIKASRRCTAFADQLPDLLQLVGSSLRSGFSLAQALDAVVREGAQPAAAEFARALTENRLGVPLEDALDGVAARMGSADLSWVVMAVRISRDVGGNLAEVLLTTVHTIRARAQLKRQVRALSAEGRLSAYILIGLPIFVAGWFLFARPQYLRPLYTQPLGLVMLTFAVSGVVVGAIWMSRVVKVEV